MTKANEPKSDVYDRITARIVEQLEQGVRPWFQPWGACGTPVRPLRHNGVPYRGINTVLLWMAAAQHGYASRYWLTYRQASELGGQVRKGERSTQIVYANVIEKPDQSEQGEDITRRIPFMKAYAVFNAQQIDGLLDSYYAMPEPTAANMERIEAVDRFFANTKAVIREGGDKAYYSPALDLVQVPPFAAFVSAEAHASTVAHELVHWTSHADRVNRDLSRYGKDNSERAWEELIAELGSVFVCADLGIAPEPRDDHAAYIASWVELLQDQKRAVFQAASAAEKAVAYLHSLQPDRAADTEDGEEEPDRKVA